MELGVSKCWEIVVGLDEEVLGGAHSRGRPCLARGRARLSQGADLYVSLSLPACMGRLAWLWPSRVPAGPSHVCLGLSLARSAQACLCPSHVCLGLCLWPSRVSPKLALPKSCLPRPIFGRAVSRLAWLWPSHLSLGLALGAKRVSVGLALAKSRLPRLASGQLVSPLAWLWPSHGLSGLALARSWLPQLGSRGKTCLRWPGSGGKTCLRCPGSGQVMSPSACLGAKHVSADLALAKSWLLWPGSGQVLAPPAWLWPGHGFSGLALARSWRKKSPSGAPLSDARDGRR